MEWINTYIVRLFYLNPPKLNCDFISRVMSAPATMIYYPTYELIRDKLYERSDNVMVPAVSGAISRC